MSDEPNAETPAPDAYNGEHGYWWNDDWYPDAESVATEIVDAGCHAEWTPALCIAAGESDVRRGVPVPINHASYIDRMLDEIEENYYESCDYDGEPDLCPRSGLEYDALIAALKAVTDEMSAVYTAGAVVDISEDVRAALDEVAEDTQTNNGGEA